MGIVMRTANKVNSMNWRSITLAAIENTTHEATNEDKKKKLYLDQKKLLDTFLEHKAISKAQYDKSLGDLTEKMGMRAVLEGKA